jgi:hypothetical protein
MNYKRRKKLEHKLKVKQKKYEQSKNIGGDTLSPGQELLPGDNLRGRKQTNVFEQGDYLEI